MASYRRRGSHAARPVTAPFVTVKPAPENGAGGSPPVTGGIPGGGRKSVRGISLSVFRAPPPLARPRAARAAERHRGIGRRLLGHDGDPFARSSLELGHEIADSLVDPVEEKDCRNGRAEADRGRDERLAYGAGQPAAMKLLGDWNWYLPRWLAWLPHLTAEPTGALTLSRP